MRESDHLDSQALFAPLLDLRDLQRNDDGHVSMSDLQTLARQMVAAKDELDTAMREHEERVHKSASTDRASRVAKASAYLSSSGSVAERTAHVDQATADLQYEAKLADGLERSALEAIRSKRQVLSSLQSLASLVKAEAELARWNPREAEGA